MRVYSDVYVERLLRSYLDIRSTLEGSSQQLHDVYIPRAKPKRSLQFQPFGQTTTGDPWPFMEPRHAKQPQDGKTKARFLEDLLCAAIDLEAVFPLLTEDDQELLIKYHITQGYTLDELMVERGVTSRGSMRQRISRAVTRLTRLLESKHE